MDSDKSDRGKHFVISNQEHTQKHQDLHAAVTELFWDYMNQNSGKKEINTTIHELLNWSSNQVDHGPDHPAQIITVIRRWK